MPLSKAHIEVMATPFDKHREERKDAQIKRNDIQCLIDVEKRTADIMTKVNNFRARNLTAEQRSTTSVEEILQLIKINHVVRAQFRKDTSKQSFDEGCQIEWLKIKYPDIEKLKTDIGGKCFLDGTIYDITGERPSVATKSFDTYSLLNNKYSTLKYTSEPGGAQDNQFKDVKNFVSEAVKYFRKSPDAKELFEACVDGAYYTEQKRRCLNDIIPPDLKARILITSCASILPILTPV
jgi:hypothetical protein